MISLELQSAPIPSKTDWIQTWVFIGQLIATVGGFILLYRTLKLQSKVTNDQHEIKSLELKKFVYDIRPIFKRVNKTIDSGMSNPVQVFNYTIVLTNNAAHDFSIIKEIFQLSSGFKDRDDIPILAVEEEIPIIICKYILKDLKKEVVIKIRFFDEIGTKYEQKIHGVMGDLHITPPCKINT
jgi:hypothetical protein